MTREQYIHTLKYQLEQLNKEIDIKIIKGETYTDQARKHKILLSKMRTHGAKNFFSKLSALLDSFLHYA